MGNSRLEITENKTRRKYGLHLTSMEIFTKFIFPDINDKLRDYIWVDLYAGEGNLILPILNNIPREEREDFFKNHIFLFDIHENMRKKCIENVLSYGIPLNLAQQNVLLRDNLENFPVFLKQMELPIFHITNPPYLYLGYIKKHTETQNYLKYFGTENKGYQDLYQIAMMNDLRNDINNLIYIIPSNFLFGASVSNKFRIDFLKYYNIIKMIIFETKMFEYTGTNICIALFTKKIKPKSEVQKFSGIKIKKQKRILNRNYILKPIYKYRAGFEFDEFIDKYRATHPLNVNYYLLKREVLENPGIHEIKVIDANQYKNNEYKKLKIKINDELKQKIEGNILYIRTVDTGSQAGRVGLGKIAEDFNVQGIYVSTNTYRTHPIQLFLETQSSIKDQILLKSYFNFILETFRIRLDSEFLTTYKYSNADYTRKYLGLTQARRLIQTFPVRDINLARKNQLEKLIVNQNFEEILKFLEV
jgi:hypothetical protein